jgi:ribosome-associated protein
MVDDEQIPSERPSKSARKRESQALQDLGEELIDLPDSVFGQLDLPETLREAILAARTMTSRGALLRQRQFIGRLMRKIDPRPVREAIEKHRLRQRSSGARFHDVEDWRDRLLGEGMAAVPALRAAAASVDTAQVRRLLESIERAHDAKSRRAAARALFRYLDRHFPA